MTRRRAGLAVAALVALVLAGCTGTASTPKKAAPPAATAGHVEWQACPDVAKSVLGKTPAGITFDCGKVPVPQDWAHPDSGKTFSVALLRARADGQQNRIGSLLTDPGGPGASGVEYAAYLATVLPGAITKRFDIVGFDPRGVGRSDQVKCFSDAQLDASFAEDPDPVSQADFAQDVTYAKQMDAACATKYGASLPLYSTEQAARDMDAIRAGLGDDKLSYLGYSYGTLLGAVYAQLFPAKVRTLVLDGAVDPAQDAVEAAESQAKGFERAFDDFAAWCRQNATRCPIAADPRGGVMAAMANARTSPVRGTDGRLATSGWIFTAVIEAMYSQSEWPLLASAIGNLGKQNAALTFRLADGYAQRDAQGHYTNLFDANAIVNCTDAHGVPTVDQTRALQSEWRQKYPMFGPSTALNLLCAQWPGKHDPPPTGKAAGAPPIVVVGTTGDPATPYEQTAKLAGELGTGVVLTWQGEGHTAYPQTPCITNAVNHYLLDLVPPPAGTTCPAK